MKNKIISIYIILIMLCGIFYFIPQSEALWWDSSYQYMKVLPINNPSANYQIKLIVFKNTGIINCSNHCQDDFDDLRFTTSSNTTLDYWIENYSSTKQATVWVETNGGTSINMYYGNAGVSTTSNGTKTFNFFDDFFGGALNNTRWTTVGVPSIIISGGALNITNRHNGNADYIYGASFGKNYAIRSRHKSVISKMSPGLGFNLQPGSPCTTPEYFTTEDCGSNSERFIWADTVAYTASSADNIYQRYYQIFDFIRTSTNVIGLVNASEICNSGTNEPTGNCPVSIGEKYSVSQAGGGYIDWILVRKRPDTESTVGIPHQEVVYSILSPPQNSNPLPSNNSINIPVLTNLTITVTSPNGYLLNITFKTNASGSWQTIASRNNIGNGTYTNTTTAFTIYNHKYWWNVSTNDGMGQYDNDTYTFTTNTIHTKINTISPYNQSGNNPLTITSNGSSDLSNVTLYYKYSPNNFSNAGFFNDIIWLNTSYDSSGGGTLNDMDYVNEGVIQWKNSSTILGYFAVYQSGTISIYNLTNGSKPVFVNSKSDGTYLKAPHDIKIVDYSPNKKIAFICNYDSSCMLTSWNITNPMSISMLDNVAGADTGMYMDIDYINKILYLTHGATISSYNISDPSNMILIDSDTTGLSGAWIPCLYNTTLYIGKIGSAPYGITIFSVTSDGLITYQTKINSTEIYTHVIVDNFLYTIAYYSKQLAIFNLSNPLSPSFVSLSGQGVYSNLFVTINHYAYCHLYNATLDNGIQLINCTDPYNPVFIKNLTYNVSNKMGYCHWIREFYNNITNKHNLFVYNSNENALICYEVFYGLETNWMEYNTDNIYPFSFSFDFPDGTGYYEFYSIGQKTGSASESAPSTKDAMCYYMIIINNLPVASNPIPINGSINSDLNPSLSIDVSDIDVDLLDVYFRTNASGSWSTIGSNTSVYNGTYRQSSNNMTSYNTKYWWSINISDSIGWSNYTYSFTTKSNTLPMVTNEYPMNGSTGVSVYLHGVHAYFSDGNGDTIFWNITIRNESSWNTDNNETGYCNTTYKFSYNTTYYWWANVTDSFNTSVNYFHFITMMNNAPVISSPYPSNNSLVSSSLTQIRIHIEDLEIFNYSIELSNGLTTSGNGVSNGTKTLNIVGGLTNGKLYTWWVNATDGTDISTAKYYFTTSNTSIGIGGNVTISFEINQFSIIILIVLMIFFTLIGYSVSNSRTAMAFVLFAGIFCILTMISVDVYFGGIWYLSTPGFIVISIIFFKDVILMMLYGDRWKDKGKGKNN